ncbi:AI-2E family transporter [Gallicola sp. Sow4_E12]|uniref:AI-2E family transporter n=1 Tax=Gallicola sp. Sow4_E12 TaxID=3438785 RepID=UPI003F922B2C
MKLKVHHNVWKIILFIGIVLLIIFRFDHFTAIVKRIGAAATPILIGLALAFILNIIMVKYEKLYFPKSTRNRVVKSRRPICLTLAILSVLLVFYFIGSMVIPQFIKSVQVLVASLPELAQKAWNFAIERGLDPTQVGINPDMWNQPSSELVQKAMEFGRNFMGGFLNIITSVFGVVTNILMGFAFAIFLLGGKEKILHSIGRVLKAYLPKEKVITLYRNAAVFNQTFKDFFGGQFIEAIIIGVIATSGMLLLRLPYATMIGSVVGLTNIIPIIGPFIGGAIGVLLILLENPIQALVFAAFVLVLQQIEGNILYPRVVGSSIGLAGIWVFAAIILGTGLFGLIGALLAVPITASLYKILKYDVEKKEEALREKIKKDYDPEIVIVEHE